MNHNMSSAGFQRAAAMTVGASAGLASNFVPVPGLAPAFALIAVIAELIDKVNVNK